MSRTTLEIVLPPGSASDSASLRSAAARSLDLPPDEITGVRVRRRSIDARGRSVRVRMVAEVWMHEPMPEEPPLEPRYPTLSATARRVVIVGAGPAGLFAALRLIEHGIRPVIVERGRDVRARRRDLAAIQRFDTVNPDSNYCFGEGGAGTYSDGKLYTRATKRGDVAGALRTLVAHGADPDILVDAHPHIGSNRLPRVVAAMRESVLAAGGEVHFEQRVAGFVRDGGGVLRGVTTIRGGEFVGDGVVLATGHSARDIFHLLVSEGISVEGKPFAVGVRVEHPQPLIDTIQYRTSARDLSLPAASYRLACTVEGRGVYSFCMCPGGFIVPAATEPDEVVVNGMSLSRRDSPFANSGMVVGVEPVDIEEYAEAGPLAGVAFQKEMERAAQLAGGGTQRAPAQRLTDFLARRASSTLPACSYKPGLQSAPLHEVLPAGIARRLRGGLEQFGRTMRGYRTEEAVLVGVETRTSSPVRVPRDSERLVHPGAPGLYPCGEGAGYAGGIISAALDGVRVADAVAGSR